MLGEGHPEVATNLNNLALLFRQKGDLDQAERLFREIIEIDRKNLGDFHPYVAGDMRSLAAVLMSKGDHKSAEEYLRQGLAIQRKTFPEKNWQIATTKLLMGACLVQQGRFREAEALLLEAFSIVKDSFGPTHRRTQAAIQDIIKLYEAWGKPEKAAEYKGLAKDSDPTRKQ